MYVDTISLINGILIASYHCLEHQLKNHPQIALHVFFSVVNRENVFRKLSHNSR
jgi:hypothetical protein